MPNFQSLPGKPAFGFDADRKLLVLPWSGPGTASSTLYLLDDGSSTVRLESTKEATLKEVSVSTDDKKAAGTTSLGALKWLRLRKFTLTGKAVGETVLHADETADPVTVRVVANGEYSQVSLKGVASDAFKSELRQLGSLRLAVLRVAQDQMCGIIGRTSGKGFGSYGLPDKMMQTDKEGKMSLQPVQWCGAFARWCWSTAATLTNVADPFTGDAWAIASPQRGISWAMRNPTLGTAVQYAGSDPGVAAKDKAGKPVKVPDQRLISLGEVSICPADIMLFRGDTKWIGGHVALVSNPPNGGAFTSIDGNSGNGSYITEDNPHSASEPLKGDAKQKAFVFIHVHVDTQTTTADGLYVTGDR